MNRPELLAPRDLAALAAALGRATPDSRLLAGGTDLMLRLRTSVVRPDLLIDLSGLRELSFIRKERGLIRIGAMTTFAQMQRNAMLEIHASCLARAAAHVGSLQIRNVATLGGNVANASPCADAIPALLVLDAQVGAPESRRQRGAASAARRYWWTRTRRPLDPTKPSSTSLSYRCPKVSAVRSAKSERARQWRLQN